MNDLKKESSVAVKIAKLEDFVDLYLCAGDFIDFIQNFKKKFYEGKLFILTAIFNGVLAGVLISEDESRIIDSIDKIIPTMHLYLIYVNPTYRNKKLGKILIDKFITYAKKKGIGSIYIKLPEKYKNGIKFFERCHFQVEDVNGSEVILHLNLWNDYGVRNCEIVDEDLNNHFTMD
jgi:GNAT superfamily N-acetyltransferase